MPRSLFPREMETLLRRRVAYIRDELWYPVASLIMAPLFIIGYVTIVPLARYVTRCRRAKGEKPRILWAAYALPQTSYMVRADRLAGYDAGQLVWYPSYYNQPWELSVIAKLLAPIGRALVMPRYVVFLWTLMRYDMFQYHFRQRQLSETVLETSEFWLLKWAGKTVICCPYGGDAFLPGMKGGDGRDLFSILLLDYPGIRRRKKPVARNLAAASRHASWIIGVPPHIDIMPRCDEMRHCVCVDLQEWAPRESASRSDAVIIAHSSNHRNIKGTQFIIDATQRLIADGYPVKLDIIEGVSREEAKERYGEADIIVEQLVIGIIGMTAVEGMAMGKPVVSYLRADVYDMPGWAQSPIVNANKDNLAEVLRELAVDREKRERIGRCGRRFVSEMYSMEAWAMHNKALYSGLWCEVV